MALEDEVRQQLDELQSEVAAMLRERDELEQRLADAQQRLEAFERQWQTLGAEIHDGLLQDLTAALFFLEAAKRDATFSSPEGLDNVERGLRLIRDAVGEGRRLISGAAAMPPQVESLSEAIRQLAGRIEQDHGIAVAFIPPPREPRLSPAVRWTVLRIVREALSNVWRHSRSPRAEVTLREHGGELIVAIRDWGQGFDPLTTKPESFGLAGIRERARLLGGTATITSRPGEGTVVEVKVPITEGKSQKGANDAE